MYQLLLPSSMATSLLLLACLFLVFILPCFSYPCPPLTTLPCNNSIQIRPPFYFQSEDDWNDPPCDGGHIKIVCGKDGPLLNYRDGIVLLKSISYNLRIMTVQVPVFSNSLNAFGCNNLHFNCPPVNDNFDEIYSALITNLSSLRCNPPGQVRPAHPKILGKPCNVNPLSHVEGDKPLRNCLGARDSGFTFELNLLFTEDSEKLSLQSATYLNFSCKGHTHRKIMITILGSVLGSGFLIALFSVYFLNKRRKLRLASSSSNLLAQRQCSDQYYQDVEVAGTGYYTRSFCYKELEEATEGFSESKELGDGGFGVVYKGKLKDGRTVAVKRLYKNNYKRAEQFMNEVEILSQLHHPNLVALYGRCNAPTTGELLLVYEFISNGTVADHLHGPRSGENVLAWPVRLSIAIETANALAYLHAVEPPIIHRDVKTNNILLDGDFHVKVADFGLSRLFPLDVTHVSTVPQGTPGYVDPVYRQCYHLTDKSDVYSFGVVLVELISSKPAVDLSRSKEEINLANMALIKIQNSQLDEIVDPALGFRSNWEVRCMISLVAELAFRCLQFDRETRPSIKEVLEALKEIEKGDYNRDKLLKENMTKEETYLLKCDEQLSPDIMTDSWTSSSVAPDTSG